MTDQKHTQKRTSISDSDRSAIASLAKLDQDSGIKVKFIEDAERAKNFSFNVGNLFLDLSKTHLSDELIDAYSEFAKSCEFVDQRKNLFTGAKINLSENRSVLHTLLRDPTNQGLETVDTADIEQAKTADVEFFDKVDVIQTQLSKRTTPIRNIIHVGIGGSSLGTQLVFQALAGIDLKIKVHFLANIDGHQLARILDQCKVDDTMVIGVSKTFSTAETLQNLDSIADWFVENGSQDYADLFYAVTAKPNNAVSYGIAAEKVVSFPEWVGGRYSVWSAVSLSTALVIGVEKFREFLDGAAQVDSHFYNCDLSENVCFLSAVLDHYYVNFLAASSRAIFPYDDRLRSLVAYLQQLETESNGKDRQKNGALVDQKTSPVVWGGVGTDVQHSVFQMLHQGTALIPAEFILVKQPDHDFVEHHRELLANGLAQPAALLAGQTLDQVEQLDTDTQLSAAAKKAKIFSGERPSTTILLEKLAPKTLGALLAFYEHRTFCNGVFTNINSFDQMGVELGKRLAKQVRPMLESEAISKQYDSAEDLDSSDLDPSTLNLLKRIKQ